MPEDFDNRSFFTLISNIPGLDVQSASEAIGDPALYKNMLAQCVRLLPLNIRDMDRAVLAGDWHTFAVKTHGLKGSLRQIGNFGLSAAGEALEKAAKTNDPAYCLENYEDFKDGLSCFFAKIAGALESCDEESAAEPVTGEIRDYKQTFEQVKTALEDFDSILAAEILTPLTGMKFGGGADELIAGAAQALEFYQPQKALDFILDLLKLCSDLQE